MGTGEDKGGRTVRPNPLSCTVRSRKRQNITQRRKVRVCELMELWTRGAVFLHVKRSLVEVRKVIAPTVDELTEPFIQAVTLDAKRLSLIFGNTGLLSFQTLNRWRRVFLLVD